MDRSKSQWRRKSWIWHQALEKPGSAEEKNLDFASADLDLAALHLDFVAPDLDSRHPTKRG
jgi:hypothetical protein